MKYRLLEAFADLFCGKRYNHRRSQLGDHVASFLYEDLFDLGRSAKLVERVRAAGAVLNTANLTVGRTARRGDGTFGEAVPDQPSIEVGGYSVRRGRIAAVEIGAETKILAKAMIKQIDRVNNDLRTQADHFRTTSPNAICVAIVGVNHALEYVSVEGRRKFKTDGKHAKHPIQEAPDAIQRLRSLALPRFDEFLLLPFSATNVKPFPFDWINETELKAQYAAALTRISREYEQRF
ncbi:MAG: hypothetical protein U0638_07230 [Phycisphaerales bacterium]